MTEVAEKEKTYAQALSLVFLHLSAVPEGRELLDLARRKECTIRHDDTLPPHRHGYTSLLMQGLLIYPVIALNPKMSLSQQVLTLGHELRHLWQPLRLKMTPDQKTLTPPLRLGWQRVREGDAYAFEAYLGEKIRHMTGLDTSKQPFPGWRAAFDNFQRGGAKLYDDMGMEDCEKNAKNVIVRTSDAVIITKLSELFTIRAAADLGDLRRMTRAGLAPDAPCYLGHKSNDELIESVLKHVKPEILARAKALTP